MRKIIVGSFITLDGVMQAAGGPEEGFEYGDDLQRLKKLLEEQMMILEIIRHADFPYPR